MFPSKHIDKASALHTTFLNSFELLNCTFLNNSYPNFEYIASQLRHVLSAALYRELPFIQERQRQYAIDEFFAGNNSYAGFFLKALNKLSSEFINLKSGKMFFVSESVPEWVECYSSKISTVPMIGAKLAESLNTIYSDPSGVSSIIREIFRSPIIPFPDDPQMKDMQIKGFAELHLHFSNSAYPADIWEQVLISSAEWIRIFWDDKNTRQIWEYLLPQVMPGALNNRIKIAKLIREWLVLFLLNGEIYREDIAGMIENACCYPDLYTYTLPQIPLVYSRHPAECLPGFSRNDSSLVLEGAMWTLVLMRLERESSFPLARMLHLYHIISSIIFKLSVHQLYFTGFDLFDILAGIPLRNLLERTIVSEKLQQIIQSGCLKKLELRVAGKENIHDFVNEKLQPLIRAFDEIKPALLHPTLIDAFEGINRRSDELPYAAPDFGIICHFIKKKDNLRKQMLKLFKSGLTFIQNQPRHAELRNSLLYQLNALISTRNETLYGKYIIGIDGAGSEFSTPSEVFAPIFRELQYRMRAPMPQIGFLEKCNLPPLHYTFHAGEDFDHLISGIRAVHEAVEFLDLPKGSRLGHCVAIGIKPEQWLDMNPEVGMSKMQRLDDLVWILKFVDDNPLEHDLKAEINSLCNQIYRESHNHNALFRAWGWRHLGVTDNELILPSQTELRRKLQDSLFLYGERSDRRLIRDKEGHNIFSMYHYDLKCYEEGEKIITVQNKSDRQESMIKAIKSAQQYVISLLCKKQIAIETCPGSNMKISPLESLEDHPIFQWYSFDTQDDNGLYHLIATDNPGLCQTSLPLEYCAIKQAAICRAKKGKKNISTIQLQNWLNTINNDSHSRSFLNNGTASVKR
jgi:hypothetical protein